MKWLYLTTLIFSILLFVGGPGYESHRIYQYAWDTGHVFLFFTIAYIILKSRSFQKKTWFKSLLIIIFLSLSVGIAIEFIQLFFNRNFEAKDILNDLFGALIGFLIYQLKIMHHPILHRLLFSLGIGVLLILSFLPLIKVLIDEVNMRNEFPLLANFESTYQLTRWDANLAELAYSDLHVSKGLRSLRVVFSPGKYPDISLQHFVTDWSEFNFIEFDLYNAQSSNLEINLKVYDKAHIHNGYNFSDRFNKEILLKPGWNHISVSVSEVFNAPKNRIMNSTEVKSFSLFVEQTNVPLTFYLDSLMLK